MLLDYEFFAPRRIVFGWGRRREIGSLARGLGRRAFLIRGSKTLESNGVFDEIAGLLAAQGVEPIEAAEISHEPEVADVDRAARFLREHSRPETDLVLAVGGGSAMDLGKAAAALATNVDGASVLEYLEGVGAGLRIARPPLPLIAMPTTAGTGSEATKNAVISSYDPPFKKSLRSDLMVPRAVLIDPELTVSLPAAATAWCGMDAITQLIESYLSSRAKPIPQALALAGLELAAPALIEAVADGGSRSAREALAHAAILSGMALANSGLGLAHGVAAALGAHCRAPHGLACAVMLPVAMRFNRPACEAPMARLGAILTGRSWPAPSAAADAAVDAVEQLCAAVHVPRRLSEIGVRREQIPDLVRGSQGNSMNGNPRPVTDAELTRLLEEML